MSGTSLLAFLVARLDEAASTAKETLWKGSGNKLTWEEAASATLDVGGTVVHFDDSTIKEHVWLHDPAHVLADAAAKNQLIDLLFDHAAERDDERGCGHTAAQIRDGRCEYIPVDDIKGLRILATAWADHRNYREEWRPDRQPDCE